MALDEVKGEHPLKPSLASDRKGDEPSLSAPSTARLRRSRHVLGRLTPLLRHHRWTVAAIAGCSAVAGIAEATLLAVVAYVAAAMSTETTLTALSFGPLRLSDDVSMLLVLAVVLAGVRFIVQLFVARLPARLSGEVQTRLRTELYESFLAASWTEKAADKEGSLQELMGAQSLQAGGAVLFVANALSAALMFSALVASAFILNAVVAAAIMVTVVLLFTALRPLSRAVRRRSAATSAASIGQASTIAESVRMAQEIQVFGASVADCARIEQSAKNFETNYVRTRSLSRIVPSVYESAVILLVLAALGIMHALGTTPVAVLGAIVLLLIRAASYGQQFQTAYQGVGEALPYLDRIAVAIERYRAHARPSVDRQIESVESIEFDSVSFTYGSAKPALRGISFSIREGEAVGIVGPTGAGKSTLVQLLLRLREPTHGSYFVNGISAAEIGDETWHQKVAYLPQDPHLLHATVAENIRFFRDDLGDADVERSARLAHIHADIQSWASGYQTIIGQRADAVSGGQRQRLCLARALAGDPKVLVLDEPTSALDPHSETLIQGTLEALHGRLTLVVVAHRLTTLKLCDRVMVMREGRIEAFDHASLLYASNDFYRHAADLAASGSTP